METVFALQGAGSLLRFGTARAFSSISSEGSATINFFKLPSGPPHFSVETRLGNAALETEQMILNTAKDTTIRSVEAGANGNPFSTLRVALPNARNAFRFQRSILEQPAGTYNPSTNSCVTHVCDVLWEGGLNAPANS